MEKDPDKFAECVELYRKIRPLDDIAALKAHRRDALLSDLEKDKKYYKAMECEEAFDATNQALKRGKDACQKAPESVKSLFTVWEADYGKFTLNGDIFEFSYRVEFVPEYPGY